MIEHSKLSSLQLIIRGLLPSLTSLVVSAIVAAILVGGHLLLISIHADKLLPTALSQGWLQSYTNFVTQPVKMVLSNGTLNSFLTVILWAFVGLVVYTLIEYSINLYERLRQSSREIYRVSKESTVAHPLRHTIIIRMLWRLLIGIVVIMITIAAQPFIRYLLNNDLLVHQRGIAQAAGLIAINLAGWMLLLHIYLVLLRLYMFRTRVFGEIIY